MLSPGLLFLEHIDAFFNMFDDRLNIVDAVLSNSNDEIANDFFGSLGLNGDEIIVKVLLSHPNHTILNQFDYNNHQIKLPFYIANIAQIRKFEQRKNNLELIRDNKDQFAVDKDDYINP